MRKILLTLASFALVGCGDSTGPVASAEGTWKLQTPLPFTLGYSDGPPVHRLEIVSDVFIAHGDGTYNETLTYRETQGTSVTTTQDTDAGTWSQNNAELTFTSSVGTRYVSIAVISDNMITAHGARFCRDGCHPDVVNRVLLYARQ